MEKYFIRNRYINETVNVDHNSLTNRDATDCHPASSISYDDGTSTLSNVQTAIDKAMTKLYETGETIDSSGLVRAINSTLYTNKITTGTTQTFNNGSTFFPASVQLDTNKILLAYSDDTSDGAGTACVVTISGTTATYGTPVVFSTGETQWIEMDKLDSSRVILSYADYGNDKYGTACVLSVSGTTITAGTPVVYESAEINYHGISVVDTDKALVCYSDYGNDKYPTGCVLSVSETTITAGTPVVIESKKCEEIACVSTNTNKVVMFGCSWYGTSASDGQSYLLTVSGTSFSVTHKEMFFNNPVYFCDAVKTETNQALVIFSALSGGNPAQINYVNIVNDKIYVGNYVVIGSVSDVSINLQITKINTNQYLVLYSDYTSGQGGKYRQLNYDGTNIKFGDAYTFLDTAPEVYGAFSCSATDSDKAVIFYRDTGTTVKGKSLVITAEKIDSKKIHRLISSNNTTVFESAESDYFTVTQLRYSATAGRFLITYIDRGNSNRGTACIVEYSDNVLTAGTPVVFESNEVFGSSVCRISDGASMLVCYESGGHIYAKIIHVGITDTTITVNTINDLGTGNDNSLLMLLPRTETIESSDSNADNPILIWYDGTNFNCAKLTVDTNTVTKGSNQQLKAGQINCMDAVMVSSDSFVVTYGNYDGADTGYANYVTIGESTFTVGSTLTISGTSGIPVYSLETQYLDIDKCMLVYKIVESGVHKIIARVLTINSTDVIAWNPILITDMSTYNRLSLAKIDYKRFMYIYRSNQYNKETYMVIFSESNNEVIIDHTYKYFSDFEIAYPKFTRYNGSSSAPKQKMAILCYQDESNNKYGTIRMLKYEDATGTALTSQITTNDIYNNNQNINAVPYLSLT